MTKKKLRWAAVSCAMAALTCLTGCGTKTGSKADVEEEVEDSRAKELLQGVWMDSETEETAFWAKGDTIYYADSLSQPTAFAVVGDELVLRSTDSRYKIEKQTEHIFWFRNQAGDIVKMEKSNEPPTDELVRGTHQSILTYTEVVKLDSVVTFEGERYHWYIAINPTKYKVHTTGYSDDGVEVDKVYYDNIMHVSVFRGGTKFFSRDFRKQQYAGKVPAQFLEQSVLSNMEFAGVSKRGFAFIATICIPDGATCYKAENVISFDGQLTSTLVEY